MTIIHYLLGVPPYRSGGLTRYALDLAAAQKEHHIVLLHPRGQDLTGRWHIRQCKPYKGMTVYGIINPLPVPLLYGVRQPEDFLREDNISIEEITSFIDAIRPDVIHLHTLMGLPRLFLQVAHERQIRLIFTTHDYYGLCLRVNNVTSSGQLCTHSDASHCAACNAIAPSTTFLRLRNEPVAVYLKPLISRNIGVRHTQQECAEPLSPQVIHRYERLKEYYIEMFSLITTFHFNSQVAREVYEQHLGKLPGEVIHITHSNISDHRQRRTIASPVRIGYIGSLDYYKGFPLLKSVLAQIDDDYILNVWGSIRGVDDDNPRIIYRGKFSDKDIAEVYNTMDLLVVPSLWQETFSLVTLEALSYGTPVVVSNTVGAKDIVARYAPDCIFHTPEELHTLLVDLIHHPAQLEQYHRAILSAPWHHALPQHAEDILSLYMR